MKKPAPDTPEPTAEEINRMDMLDMANALREILQRQSPPQSSSDIYTAAQEKVLYVSNTILTICTIEDDRIRLNAIRQAISPWPCTAGQTPGVG